MIKHRLVPVHFDTVAWGNAIKDACSWAGHEFMAEYICVSVSTLKKWETGKYVDGFEYPSMTNFLKVCNLLDFNPQTFFTTADL